MSSRELMSLPEDTRLLARLVGEVYKQGYTALYAMPAVALVATLLLWNEEDSTAFLVWNSIIIVVSLLRLFLILRYERISDEAREDEKCINYYFWLEIASGLTWGALVYWLYPDEPAQQVLVLLILGAMATGAAAMLAALPRIYGAYLFSSGLSVVLALFSRTDEYSVYLALFAAIYSLVLWFSSISLGNNIKESIRLAMENVSLLETMQSTNRQLEQQISQTQDAERKSRDAEARFRTLANATNEGVILYENGHIIDCNQRITEMLGYSSQDLYNLNIEALFEGDSKDLIKTVLKQDDALSHELICLRKDYSSFHAEVSKRRLTGTQNDIDVITIHDITEMKRMAEIKEQFISTVSHELRTPLTSIHASLGLVIGGLGGELNSRMQELLGIALQNSERLGTLINDLLDIQKLDAGKLSFNSENLDIMELVNQAMELNTAYGDKYNAHYLLKQGLFDAMVYADRNRLIQVITNLLSNAAKFSPKGSDIEISITREDNKVRVAIRDHGPGIPEAFRDKIFQRFSQADATTTRHQGGSGLGLYISQQIIQQMNGDIGFETETGKGTTFYFTLPIVN
ncbi:MAG: PAS domain-containing protein [Gammaproteobacteria bacterium]|nr:PAS domain-containing protein [Gammaproteobacteria bacterium]